jgi:hypothetical protein
VGRHVRATRPRPAFVSRRRILFGRRYVDLVTELPNERIRIDLRRFHDVEPDGTQ